MALRHPGLVLAVAAILLLAPSLAMGTLISHSAPQNLLWAQQFADQFRAGVLYPRWLPESFDRLGGPVFYYYPPLAFWLDALLSVATANLVAVSYRLSLVWLLMLWASGLGMHAWLKADAREPWAALVGSVAYMVAPYHLFDHYVRGAYAEFAAYAFLPLVALAVRRVAERRRFGLILLATAYAGLTTAHLPASLLVSMTVLPLYVLYRGWRLGEVRPAIGFFARCTLGGGLGLGLAAIYLVPALTLQGWISAEQWWTPHFQVGKWSLLPFVLSGDLDGVMVIVAWGTLAYGLAVIGVLTVLALARRWQGLRSEAAFWSFACLLCLMIVAGLVPWFWQIPFAARVQFPWRLMMVVEFAAITSLCLVSWKGRSPLAGLIFGVAALALVPCADEIARSVRAQVDATMTDPHEPTDAKEYLPAGYPQKADAGPAELSLEALQHQPTISCRPATPVCRADEAGSGDLRIEVEGPTTVTLRRFFFPAWRLDPELAIAADPMKLVSFTAPAGRHAWRLERRVLPAEQWGRAISGLSLILLLGAAALSARSSAA